MKSYGQQWAQKLQKDVDQLQSEQAGCENSSQRPAEGIGIASFDEKEAEERYESSILKKYGYEERRNKFFPLWMGPGERHGVTARD